MGPFGRIIAQVVVVGTQVLSRAFIEAYKQAAANGARNTARSAAPSSSSAAKEAASSFSGDLTRKTGISLEEAAKILNVDTNASMDQIIAKYDHMFKQNDPKNGGSLYLQSKVFRAKERFELERKASGDHPSTSTSSSSSSQSSQQQ